MYKIHSCMWLLFAFINVNAQSDSKTEIEKGNRIINIQFHYTYTEPSADLANRFGYFHSIGTGAVYKSANHWLVGAELCYQFGDIVKEPNLFNNLVASTGAIMNSGGYLAELSVGQRGFYTTARFGRMFPVSSTNRNTGIMAMIGVGYYTHKIYINSRDNDIPPLSIELRKGYDRLSAGPAFSQTIGYMHHSRNRYYNFYAGIEFMQSFTTSLRGFNYDQMAYDTKTYQDFTYGFRFAWMIPIYLNSGSSDEYYYK
ncbi:MAG: hypothetical protein ACK45I_05890 [Bacteroidota bacterium]